MRHRHRGGGGGQREVRVDIRGGSAGRPTELRGKVPTQTNTDPRPPGGGEKKKLRGGCLDDFW